MVKIMLKVTLKVLCFSILNIVRKTLRSYLNNIPTYDIVITLRFTNIGASKELLVEMNTIFKNTVFSFEILILLDICHILLKKKLL